MAFLGCLWKFGMGFLHGDANTRQCMATAVTAYKQSFGFDAPPADLPEPTDREFPFTLLTGRGTSSQWHTLTRTGKSDVLKKLCPTTAYVELHPQDAAALGLGPNDTVLVRSRRGELCASVYIAPTVRPGQVFIPMHYPAGNQLTHPSFDPHSRQPNYKACAVSLTKA